MKTPNEMAIFLIKEFNDKANVVAKIARDYTDSSRVQFWDSVQFEITKQTLIEVRKDIDETPDLPNSAYRYEY